MQRAHTIHIYIKLPEPIGIPENYIIHSYLDGSHYSGRGIRAFVTDNLDVREMMPEGIICRFVHLNTQLEPPINESITAARTLWPSLAPPEHQNPRRSLDHSPYE